MLVLLVGFATFGLQTALNLQLTPVDLARVADGSYTGAYENARWSNRVEVTVQDHAITAVEPEQNRLGNTAVAQQLSEAILREQKTDVDVVCGATASSKSFLKAVEAAFAQ